MGGSTVELVAEWLKTVEELDIKIIDSTQGYGPSEELLGKTGAASRFPLNQEGHL